MGLYSFGRVVCRAFFRLAFSVKIYGVENLPPEGQGFLTVCNHQSYFDPPLLGICLRHHQLVFMAKAELFEKPVLGPLIKKLGAFPVSRGRGDTSALERAIETVRQGHSLALFPEGTRSLTGEPLKPKSGAVVIASQTGGDIVPAAIYYKGKHKHFRSKIIIRFGKPIKQEELHLPEHPAPSEIKRASQFVMGKIIELLDESKKEA